MESNYWKGRWERGETGWHQSEIEPGLIAHFSDLKPTRVFVPLCGKSLDMTWLLTKGHEVIGVEFSSLACEAFLSENKIPFTKHSQNNFEVYRGDRITLYNGDFFKLDAKLLGTIGAIYDRAALIALPPEIRAQYTEHMIHLVKECASNPLHFIQIVLERSPHDSNGPPFSVRPVDLDRYYSRDFTLKLLSREQVDLGTSASPSDSKTDECIYQLIRKR